MWRRARVVVVVVLALGAVSAWGGGAVADASEGPNVDVVAAFYPVAYAAQRVGGDRASVVNLTPAGAEPHDLELTPKQIDTVLDADIAFVMGRGFQPAVEAAAGNRDGATVVVLDRLRAEARAAGTKLDTSDPHVWLDPVSMRAIVREVQTALTKADPKGRAVYTRNADAFVAELDALDERFRTGLADCDRTLVVTAHEAFGHLARRYGLRQEGVAGLAPDAEPDPRRLAALADLSRREGVTVVFTEELVSPRIADTLAREAGVRTAVLDPLEGLTAQAQRRGETYVSVMDENLGQLRSALGCR